MNPLRVVFKNKKTIRGDADIALKEWTDEFLSQSGEKMKKKIDKKYKVNFGAYYEIHSCRFKRKSEI